MNEIFNARAGAGGASGSDWPKRIIATAEKLFRELGLNKTTVADIARDLNMSPANVYRFFPSKAAIQEAVAANVMGELESHARIIAHSKHRASERLRLIVHSIQTHHLERLMADRKLHEMVELALSEQWPIIERHIARMRDIFSDIIMDGIRDGEFKDMDANHAAMILQASCAAYLHPRMRIDCQNLSIPTCDQMLDFIIGAFKK